MVMKLTVEQLAAWNMTFPPGSPCLVQMGGAEIETHTTGPAWMWEKEIACVPVAHHNWTPTLHRLRMTETHSA